MQKSPMYFLMLIGITLALSATLSLFPVYMALTVHDPTRQDTLQGKVDTVQTEVDAVEENQAAGSLNIIGRGDVISFKRLAGATGEQITIVVTTPGGSKIEATGQNPISVGIAGRTGGSSFPGAGEFLVYTLGQSGELGTVGGFLFDAEVNAVGTLFTVIANGPGNLFIGLFENEYTGS